MMGPGESRELSAPDGPTGGEAPKTPEIRSGEEVARLVHGLYKQLGGRIMLPLCKPSAVLTLAGLKYQADLGPTVVESTDIDRSHGLKLPDKIQLKLRLPRTQTELLGSVSLYNDAAIDQENRLRKEATELAAREGVEFDEKTQAMIEDGAGLGYPTRAIVDFVRAYRTKSIADLVPADLLSAHQAAQLYGGTSPEFDYFPEHENDPEIRRVVARSRAVLQSFYDSPEFAQIEQDPDFQTAYQQVTSARQQRS